MAATTIAVAGLAAPIAAHAETSVPAGSVASVNKSPAVAETKCTTVASGQTDLCASMQAMPMSKLTSAQRIQRAQVMGAGAGTARPATESPALTVTLPTQCDFTAGIGGLDANPDRFTSCADTFWLYTTYEVTDGVITITGTFNFEDLQWASYSATSSTWEHGLETLGYETGATGTLEDGFSALLQSNCFFDGAGICTATSLTTPDPQPVDITPHSTSVFEWTEQDAGPASTTAGSDTILSGTLGVVWDVTAPVPGIAIDVPNAAVGSPTTGLDGRCDTIATRTDGCVNDLFIPTLTYNSRSNPLVGPVARHIYTAQTATPANGGLKTKWGVPASGEPLNRDMSASDQRANRRAACSKVRLRPGTSCDEYPLATTYEGAAFNSDFSVFVVPTSANDSQGGITGSFYGSNRVIDDDAFWVRAILPNGTASW